MMGNTLEKLIKNSYFIEKNIISTTLVSHNCIYMEKKLRNFSNGMMASS